MVPDADAVIEKKRKEKIQSLFLVSHKVGGETDKHMKRFEDRVGCVKCSARNKETHLTPRLPGRQV